MHQSKQCTVCKEYKPLTEYSPDKRIASGLQSRCKFCYAAIMRNRRVKNPEANRLAVKEYTQKNYKKKLEMNRVYRLKNPNKVSEWKAKDRLVNKVRVLADNAKRRYKLKGEITPEMKQIYALRDFYTAMSLGDEFHVDHIVPLSKGGEHNAFNLQILPAIDNLRKGSNATQ
jgi:5-methylcytosine-specific restriction endonuclease McrA